MRAPESRTTPPDETTRGALWGRLGDYLAVPLRLALAPIVGCGFGWVLDRVLGTFPWLTMLLLGLGFLAGARDLWIAVKGPRERKHRI